MPDVNLVVFVSTTAVRHYARKESVAYEIRTAVRNLNIAARQCGQSPVRIGLAGISRVGFREDEDQTIKQVLDRFTGYWRDAVSGRHRALDYVRRVTRTDLALLVVKNATMASGRAWILSQEYRQMARFGCAAVTLDALVSPLHTLGHEIGHLFGCTHSHGESLNKVDHVGTIMKIGSLSRRRLFSTQNDAAQMVATAAPAISKLSTRRS